MWKMKGASAFNILRFFSLFLDTSWKPARPSPYLASPSFPHPRVEAIQPSWSSGPQGKSPTGHSFSEEPHFKFITLFILEISHMLSKALRQQVFKTANLLAIIFAFAVSALTGAGAVPAKVSLTSLSFGNVHQRTASTAKTITFYNEEAVPLTITSIATGNTDFTETNTCGQSLAAKSNCTITVTFTPSLVGAETGTLSVTDAASNSPQTATLTGTGTAQVKISPASLTFAAQTAGTTSATKNVTVTNNLSTALTIFIRFAGANPGDFSQTNTC